MDLDLTDDQAAFQEMVRDFFEKESPIAVVRAAEPLGFDLDLWRQVIGMGLHAITIPESQGGGGAGWTELAIAVEQLGASLAPVPLIEVAVASHLLASMGEATNEAVAGKLLVTIALHAAVDGVARFVPAGAVADAVIALDGEQLVLVRDPAPGPALPNLGAMPISHRPLDTAERIVLAGGEDAVAAHRAAVRQWELLTGVALVGLGTRTLELGLEYVQQRKAFGVLVANFQTVQHRFADNATALDGARLLAYEAAWAQDVDAPDADDLASMAVLFGGETAFKTAADSLQMHGGYGYTLEYDIQLFFRRAKAWPLLLGDPRLRYAELARRLYDAGAR